MSAMLQNLVDNFDAADTNGDGKVSMAEAQAYQGQQNSASSEQNTNAVASSTETGSQMEQLLRKTLQQLMDSYGQVASGDEPAATTVALTA